jgi:hypothetical protein
LTPAGSDLQVGLVENRCQPFVLQKDLGYDQRRVSTVEPPRGGGTFVKARAIGRPCDAISEWALRVSREFPTPAGQRSNRPRDAEVLLFGDEDFVPVFGAAFDALDDEVKTSLSRQWQDCKRDPLVRQRLDGIDSVDRGLMRADLTSFGRASVVYVVQEQRGIRRRIADLTRQIDASSPEQAARLAGDAQKLLEAAKANFWPSDLARLTESVDHARATAATAAAAREVERIAAIPDRIDRLRQANSVISGEASFMKGTDPERRATFIETMRGIAERDTQETIAPLLAAIAQSPPTLDGLVAVDAAVTANDRAIQALDPVARRRIDAAREARKAEIVGAAVKVDLESLQTLPSGKEGLIAGVAWRRTFDERYAGYRAMEIVKQADRAFRSDRNRRLLEAVSEFEREVDGLKANGKSSPDQARAIITAYLGWSGDGRLPASFDYLLATAQRHESGGVSSGPQSSP